MAAVKYALSDEEDDDVIAGASTSTAPLAKRRKLSSGAGTSVDDAPPSLLADPPNEAINLAPPIGEENTEAHVRPHATLSNGMPAKPQPLKATQSGSIKGKGKAAADEGGFEAVLRKLEEQRDSGTGGGTSNHALLIVRGRVYRSLAHVGPGWVGQRRFLEGGYGQS